MLIVGASTRAAAWSAVRAGWRPVCADLFADRDLAQVADVVPVADYPASLPVDLAHVSTDGWMFVGAMENHRQVLDALSSSGRFGQYCGPELSVIAQLRDPIWLAERWRPLACSPDVCVPSRAAVASPPTDFSAWLCKPLSSGGGRGIRPATADDWNCDPSGTHYWQRQVDGVSLSALLLVTAEQIQLLMVSEQLLGWPEVAAPTSFTYCGSIGPIPVTETQRTQLRLIAEALLAGLEYRGLLGLDLIWDGWQFWVIEVNPRYTASSELWEFATQRSAVGEHIAQFVQDLSPRPRFGGEGQGRGGERFTTPMFRENQPIDAVDDPLFLKLAPCDRSPPLPNPLPRGGGEGTGGSPLTLSPEAGVRGPEGCTFGKLILFADRDLIAPDLACCLGPRDLWSIPWIADVPHSGAAIPAGAPLCTVFARGISSDECRRKLLRRAERVRGWFNSVANAALPNSENPPGIAREFLIGPPDLR